MQKIIRNDWHRTDGEPFVRAKILSHDIHPEGLDVDRIRFVEKGILALNSGVGHVVSVIHGQGKAGRKGDKGPSLQLEAGVHLYIPPGMEMILEAEPRTELVRVSSPNASQARGKRLLIRNEKYLAACASNLQSLRWILTPQYLSRRIFLHHDPILLSKSKNPVSWFHTTMFDVTGLPENEEGESVFKMSYNSRTEFNVCYDVKGTARVRMAKHPYSDSGQLWGPWLSLDPDATYHLNETGEGSEEECRSEQAAHATQYLRNKHEVYIVKGHVSLFCMFDPAPTGVERHRPGEYSDYEPLSVVLGTAPYKLYQREMALYDEMVDRLSVAHATGEMDKITSAPIWNTYVRGREEQASIEGKLVKSLAAEGKDREPVIRPWMQPEADS